MTSYVVISVTPSTSNSSEYEYYHKIIYTDDVYFSNDTIYLKKIYSSPNTNLSNTFEKIIHNYPFVKKNLYLYIKFLDKWVDIINYGLY